MILAECDRCRVKSSMATNNHISIESRSNFANHYDLCDECAAKLRQFIKGDVE